MEELVAENMPETLRNRYWVSESLMEELVTRLSHTGSINKNDNTIIFQKIEEAKRGTIYKSTIKAFLRRKDEHGVFVRPCLFELLNSRKIVKSSLFWAKYFEIAKLGSGKTLQNRTFSSVKSYFYFH